MPNDNIMGIKTKACVNGVYPDTIPTIQQDIDNIEDDIDDINTELDNVVHKTGDEEINGEKTFTEDLTVHGDEVNTSGTVVLSPSSQGGIVQLKDNMNRSISIVHSHDSDNNCYLREYPDNYYPVDENENPVAPSNPTIMTSGLVAVDPRIVHTTGNETITGTKTFETGLVGYFKGWIRIDKTANVNDYLIFAKIDVTEGANRFIKLDICNFANTVPAIASIMFRTELTTPYPRWVYHTPFTVTNNPITATSIVILIKDGEMFLAWKKEYTYGKIMVKTDFETSYGYVQGLNNSRIKIYNANEITVISDVSSYTVVSVE